MAWPDIDKYCWQLKVMLLYIVTLPKKETWENGFKILHVFMYIASWVQFIITHISLYLPLN